jgi:tetratricopeptide (TPR) repeat protein
MLKKAWIVLALCSFSSALCLGQTVPNTQRPPRQDYTIHGKIIFSNNHDPDRIEVKLDKSFGQIIQVAYTDAAGNFEFRGLTIGTYFVTVLLDGYEPVRQGVDVISSFGASPVNLFLSRSAYVPKDRLTGLDADDPDIIDVSQMKENLPKKAVQDYEKAIEEKKKGRLESAVKLLEDAIRLAPNFFRAHNNLGLLYQSEKRYADAEKEFQRSHDLNAKNERPLLNLGSLYIEEAGLQGDDRKATGKLLDDALDALEQAVKMNPRSATAFFLLGQANYKSSFYEEAEAALKKAHELDPNMAAVRLMLSNVYVKEEKWADVLENLDAYLKENPKAADRDKVEEMRANIARSMEQTPGPK